MKSARSAVLNLGYASRSQGVAGSSKSAQKIQKDQNKHKIVYLGVRKGGKVVIRGYAEQENFDLGVRKH